MLAVFIAGVIALVYFSKGQSVQTEPVIKLNYFKSNLEVAETVYNTLEQDLKQQTHFWFGIEPQAER